MEFLSASNILLYLAVFLGILSILNKILLFKSKVSGWSSGMLIGFLSAGYFYAIDLRILATAEIGFFLVMLYGYLLKRELPRYRQRLINVVFTLVVLGLSIALFRFELTIYELFSSVGFIWGGYALAINRDKIGWSLFILAHVMTSLAAFMVGETIFSLLQIASITVCVFALVTQFPSFRKFIN